MTAKMQKLDYAQARSMLEQGSTAAHQALASRTDIAPEILYYLAESPLPAVRAIVAANHATPMQANANLARDSQDDVRGELARKIGRLLPGMDESERIQLREQAISILEALAADQAPRVRALLAEELKCNPRAPTHIVRRLADDPELQVCGPILEYSPLLSDLDLKEIIAATQVKGALSAIARRGSVSETLSDALARTQDLAAVSALLGNPNAQIREDTLDAILDGAPTIEEWHEPLVLRANLSIRVVRRIAGFVASALVERMIEVQALSEDIADDLLVSVRQRLNEDPIDAADQAQAEAEARHAVEFGLFHDAWILESLEQKAYARIIAALGFAAGFDVRAAKKVVATRNGRSVMALCWKAGLTARTAYEVQKGAALVPVSQLATPNDGRAYPMSEDEMEWLISTFVE
jgi:uncharacterized protein (DUF2336 family)